MPYATAVANSIGSTIDGLSFSGLLTRVDVGPLTTAPIGPFTAPFKVK
jgi:hypothetical protein